MHHRQAVTVRRARRSSRANGAVRWRTSAHGTSSVTVSVTAVPSTVRPPPPASLPVPVAVAEHFAQAGQQVLADRQRHRRVDRPIQGSVRNDPDTLGVGYSLTTSRMQRRSPRSGALSVASSSRTGWARARCGWPRSRAKIDRRSSANEFVQVLAALGVPGAVQVGPGGAQRHPANARPAANSRCTTLSCRLLAMRSRSGQDAQLAQPVPAPGQSPPRDRRTRARSPCPTKSIMAALIIHAVETQPGFAAHWGTNPTRRTGVTGDFSSIGAVASGIAPKSGGSISFPTSSGVQPVPS